MRSNLIPLTKILEGLANELRPIMISNQLGKSEMSFQALRTPPSTELLKDVTGFGELDKVLSHCWLEEALCLYLVI